MYHIYIHMMYVRTFMHMRCRWGFKACVLFTSPLCFRSSRGQQLHPRGVLGGLGTTRQVLQGLRTLRLRSVGQGARDEWFTLGDSNSKNWSRSMIGLIGLVGIAAASGFCKRFGLQDTCNSKPYTASCFEGVLGSLLKIEGRTCCGLLGFRRSQSALRNSDT